MFKESPGPLSFVWRTVSLLLTVALANLERYHRPTTSSSRLPDIPSAHFEAGELRLRMFRSSVSLTVSRVSASQNMSHVNFYFFFHGDYEFDNRPPFD